MEEQVRRYFEHSQRIRTQYEPEFVSRLKSQEGTKTSRNQHSYRRLGKIGEDTYAGVRQLHPEFEFEEEKILKIMEAYARKAAELSEGEERIPSFCIGVKLDISGNYGLVTEDLSRNSQLLIMDDRPPMGGTILQTGEVVLYDLIDIADEHKYRHINDFLFMAESNIIDLTK